METRENVAKMNGGARTAGVRQKKSERVASRDVESIKNLWKISSLDDWLNTLPSNIRPSSNKPLGMSLLSLLKGISSKKTAGEARELFIQACKDGKGRPVALAFSHAHKIWNEIKDASIAAAPANSEHGVQRSSLSDAAETHPRPLHALDAPEDLDDKETGRKKTGNDRVRKADSAHEDSTENPLKKVKLSKIRLVTSTPKAVANTMEAENNFAMEKTGGAGDSPGSDNSGQTMLELFGPEDPAQEAGTQSAGGSRNASISKNLIPQQAGLVGLEETPKPRGQSAGIRSSLQATNIPRAVNANQVISAPMPCTQDEKTRQLEELFTSNQIENEKFFARKPFGDPIKVSHPPQSQHDDIEDCIIVNHPFDSQQNQQQSHTFGEQRQQQKTSELGRSIAEHSLKQQPTTSAAKESEHQQTSQAGRSIAANHPPKKQPTTSIVKESEHQKTSEPGRYIPPRQRPNITEVLEREYRNLGELGRYIPPRQRPNIFEILEREHRNVGELRNPVAAEHQPHQPKRQPSSGVSQDREQQKMSEHRNAMVTNSSEDQQPFATTREESTQKPNQPRSSMVTNHPPKHQPSTSLAKEHNHQELSEHAKVVTQPQQQRSIATTREESTQKPSQARIPIPNQQSNTGVLYENTYETIYAGQVVVIKIPVARENYNHAMTQTYDSTTTIRRRKQQLSTQAMQNSTQNTSQFQASIATNPPQGPPVHGGPAPSLSTPRFRTPQDQIRWLQQNRAPAEMQTSTQNTSQSQAHSATNQPQGPPAHGGPAPAFGTQADFLSPQMQAHRLNINRASAVNPRNDVSHFIPKKPARSLHQTENDNASLLLRRPGRTLQPRPDNQPLLPQSPVRAQGPRNDFTSAQQQPPPTGVPNTRSDFTSAPQAPQNSLSSLNTRNNFTSAPQQPSAAGNLNSRNASTPAPQTSQNPRTPTSYLRYYATALPARLTQGLDTEKIRNLSTASERSTAEEVVRLFEKTSCDFEAGMKKTFGEEKK